MKNFEFIVKDSQGLHARPAAYLAKIAEGFSCDCFLWNGEKKADIHDLIQLMDLEVKQGDQVCISVTGYGEEEAMEKIKSFFILNL